MFDLRLKNRAASSLQPVSPELLLQHLILGHVTCFHHLKVPLSGLCRFRDGLEGDSMERT